VGRRLLKKVEEEATKAGCCRLMICIPSTRTTLAMWLERKEYFHGATLPYPGSLGHTLLKEDVELLAFLKKLGPNISCAMDNRPEPEPEHHAKMVSNSHLPPIWRMAMNNSMTGDSVVSKASE
jgi:hypothetical protein